MRPPMLTINPQDEFLPPRLEVAVRDLTEQWAASDNLGRLWRGDATLWTSADEGDWLGWLTIATELAAATERLEELASDVRGRFTDAVLLGMGGSSLCPEVLRECFGRVEGFPDFRILDSTDPQQIQDCIGSIQIESTLFLSASKSGSTLETSLLTEFFFGLVSRRIGAVRAGSRFVAITDPGSRLGAVARKRAFWRVSHGKPSIGGRYSALSNFGMVPAAAMGLDVPRILKGASAMQAECRPASPVEANPGLRLGLALGAAAVAGRDKLCLSCSPGIAPLGAWVEQLIAESTGKLGRGILPVDGASLRPSDHGDDCIFASVQLASEGGSVQKSALDELRAAGHPVIRVRVRDMASLGQEFFRWEFATAVAGAVLGINPFDQPDVESSKAATREVAEAYEARGSLPIGQPWLRTEWAALHASPALLSAASPTDAPSSVPAALQELVASLRKGDYFALLAYVNRTPETVALAERIRSRVARHSRVAATCGFGPRFLHSTGQMHKGGPNTGVFLQIGGVAGPQLAAPGRDLDFGTVKEAQALGDFAVLCRLGRRALRLDTGGNAVQALRRLDAAVEQALQ